jgi:hypothetical protein
MYIDVAVERGPVSIVDGSNQSELRISAEKKSVVNSPHVHDYQEISPSLLSVEAATDSKAKFAI